LRFVDIENHFLLHGAALRPQVRLVALRNPANVGVSILAMLNSLKAGIVKIKNNQGTEEGWERKLFFKRLRLGIH
jgi:hypothetical protein